MNRYILALTKIFIALSYAAMILPSCAWAEVINENQTITASDPHYDSKFKRSRVKAAIKIASSEINAVPSPKPDFSRTSSETMLLHLTVGHSIFVDSARRLTRVYVTDPTVVYAYTASPNQLLLTSKKSGVSSLILWDETGALQAYLISSDLDITPLHAAIKQAMPHEDIRIEGEQERITLTGTVSSKAAYDAASKLAESYSKDISNALIISSTSTKQVRLKVRIAEVDRAKLEQFGFNFFNVGGKTLAQTSTTQFPSTLNATASGASGGNNSGNSSTVGNKIVTYTNPLNFLLYSSELNVGAMIQDMETKNVLQILAEPNITTMSGEKASFLAGGEFPFPVVQGAVGSLTSISIQFRPYGVKLEFTPDVNNDGTIQLKVAPEVSALDYTNAVQISGYVIPALSTRRAETEVVLKNGQTFAISGLLDKRLTDQFGRTPGIASVPILGQLFKSKSANHSTIELIVLVTPEIVDPAVVSTASLPEQEPVMAKPMLNPQEFDDSLSRAKKKK